MFVNHHQQWNCSILSYDSSMLLVKGNMDEQDVLPADFFRAITRPHLQGQAFVDQSCNHELVRGSETCTIILIIGCAFMHVLGNNYSIVFADFLQVLGNTTI